MALIAKENTVVTETLTIPLADLNVKMNEMALEHAKKMQPPKGFRRGHVPLQYVLKLAGDRIRIWALDVLNQEAFEAHCEQSKCKRINVVEPVFEEQESKDDKNLNVSVTFEVLPSSFSLNHKKIKIKARKGKVGKKDIDEAVQRMREYHADWVDIDRAVEKGDQLELVYEDLKKDDARPQSFIIIGDNKLPKAFDKYLKGRSSGDTVSIPVKFPSDFSAPNLRGQSKTFTVKIKSAKYRVLPELDKVFAKKLQIEGDTEADIRQSIQDLLDKEAVRLSEEVFKKQLMDALVDAHKKLPCSPRLFKEHLARLAEQAQDPEEKEKILALTPKDKDEKAKSAAHAARLNVLISELITYYSIEVREKELRDYVEALAGDYQDKEAFLRWFQQDQRSMSGAYRTLLEKKLIDALKKDVTIGETEVSFSKLKEAS
jgi:trigger factor